jgi:hypothetical protein
MRRQLLALAPSRAGHVVGPAPRREPDRSDVPLARPGGARLRLTQL